MRQQERIRVNDVGQLEIIDPSLDHLALLRSVDPRFAIHSEPLPGFERPAVLATRGTSIGIAHASLTLMATDDLRDLHRTAIRNSVGEGIPSSAAAGLLDLKVELARRHLHSCRLCARNCGVNRLAGERGVCGLGHGAIVAEHFVHIAEEPPINPSLVISLAGCGLRCRFCQQGWLLEPGSVHGRALDGDLWPELDTAGARSLSFVGGNPDESVYAILDFLRTIPDNWCLPIVWNTHTYSTPEVLSLLDGVVDVYLPDLKYGSDDCARAISGVTGYVDVATRTLTAMVARASTIVRVLVLPGHVSCCHEPALRFLAGLPRERLLVSVRGQYCPDHRIDDRDGLLATRVDPVELGHVRAYAESLGLNLVAGEGN